MLIAYGGKSWFTPKIYLPFDKENLQNYCFEYRKHDSGGLSLIIYDNEDNVRNYDYVNALANASDKISSTSSNLETISDVISGASSGFSQAAENVDSIVETTGEIVSNTADLNNRLAEAFEQFKERAENSIEETFEKFGNSISTICGEIERAVGEIGEIPFEELQESIETLNDILREQHEE